MEKEHGRSATITTGGSGCSDRFVVYCSRRARPRLHQALGRGAAGGKPGGAGLFLDRVEPLLRSTCAECHNDKRAEGGLRTLTREALLSGGDSGPALVPGRPDDSLIVRAIRRHDDEISAMPPDETLAADLVAAVETWVAAGAPWARRPMKLMEDEPEVLEMLSQGGAEYGVETTDKASGGMSIRVKSPWRFAERVPGWEWKVREHPGDDEYRYLRLSWKARGETTPMVEIAYDGRWPDAKSPKGRITAGPTRSDLVSRSLSPDPPREWTTITIDLWDELGDCTVTGICLAANGARDAGEALFDAIVIGCDLESLEVYTPSRALESLASRKRMGAARTDARNPVARRRGGERPIVPRNDSFQSCLSKHTFCAKVLDRTQVNHPRC